MFVWPGSALSVLRLQLHSGNANILKYSGLKNAPARFQRFVNEVLSDEIKSGNVIVYMGDNIMKLKSRLEKKQDGQFEMRNGLVCRKRGDKLLFYVPCAMEQEIMYKYHDEFGYFGVAKRGAKRAARIPKFRYR